MLSYDIVGNAFFDLILTSLVLLYKRTLYVPSRCNAPNSYLKSVKDIEFTLSANQRSLWRIVADVKLIALFAKQDIVILKDLPAALREPCDLGPPISVVLVEHNLRREAD